MSINKLKKVMLEPAVLMVGGIFLLFVSQHQSFVPYNWFYFLALGCLILACLAFCLWVLFFNRIKSKASPTEDSTFYELTWCGRKKVEFVSMVVLMVLVGALTIFVANVFAVKIPSLPVRFLAFKEKTVLVHCYDTYTNRVQGRINEFKDLKTREVYALAGFSKICGDKHAKEHPCQFEAREGYLGFYVDKIICKGEDKREFIQE